MKGGSHQEKTRCWQVLKHNNSMRWPEYALTSLKNWSSTARPWNSPPPGLAPTRRSKRKRERLRKDPHCNCRQRQCSKTRRRDRVNWERSRLQHLSWVEMHASCAQTGAEWSDLFREIVPTRPIAPYSKNLCQYVRIESICSKRKT